MNWLRILQSPRYRALLAFICGLLMTFSYAPFNQGWLAVILIAAWLLLLVRSQTARQAMAVGFVFGFGWFGAGISWVFVSIDQFGGLPLPLSVLLMVVLWSYLALYPMLAAWLWFKTRRYLNGYSLLAFPLIWLVSEFLRGWVMTGFPWLSLGYTQTSTMLGQLAPHIGEIGLILIILLCAIGFAFALLRKQLGWLLLPVGLYALGTLAPYVNPMQPTGENLQVALVQGNLELDLKWDPAREWKNLEHYIALTEPVADHDLIVWPESAVTLLEWQARHALSDMNEWMLNEQSSLITGILDLKYDNDHPDGSYFNSIVVLGEQENASGYEYGITNRYEKHQLLPIGEFVPFENILRPIAPLFNLPASSFERGPYRQANLSANGYQIAANICYEVAFPRQIRAGVDAHTQLLLTVSNDSWFGDSHGPHQHLEIARMRAMELGRPMLRSTNSGITAMIDERGRTITRIEPFIADVASARVALVEGTTWFSRTGEWPAWLLSFLVAGLTFRKKQA